MAAHLTTAWPLCGLLGLTLAACGASGGGDVEASLGAPRSLAEMAGTADAIASSYAGAHRDSAATAPETGTARLAGQIEMTSGDRAMMGDLALLVDFGATTTQGLAGNFRTDTAPVEGTLSGTGQVDAFGGVVTLATPLSGTLDGQRVDVSSIVGLRRDARGYVGTGHGDGDYMTFSTVRER